MATSYHKHRQKRLNKKEEDVCVCVGGGGLKNIKIKFKKRTIPSTKTEEDKEQNFLIIKYREGQKSYFINEDKELKKNISTKTEEDRRTKGRGRFYQQRQRMPKTRRTIPYTKTEETEEARGRFNQQRKRWPILSTKTKN